MASAAAVAADAARSPLPDRDFDGESGTVGTITSVNDPDPMGDQEDDEDDVAPTARRKRINHIADDDDDDQNESSNLDENDGGDADLFGDMDEDEDDDDKVADNPQTLDDEDLDSGDDEGRGDRLGQEGLAEDVTEEKEVVIQEIQVARHGVPEPTDGELYLLKVPPFLAFDPREFNPETFEPPVTEHHSKKPPTDVFSAHDTAMTTIRWRKSPSDASKLQSNARILRWSDGSLTLQLATDATVQYQLPSNSLAPPQLNPPKPTPTAIFDRRRKDQVQRYNPDKDSFTYLAAPDNYAQVLKITNKLTTSLTVLPAGKDDALERLRTSLAAAAKGSTDANGDGGIHMVEITEDPELAKKKAELAEKEKLKAQRKREKAEERDRDRAGKVLGRRYGGGLSVGALEDDDRGPRSTGRAPGRPRPKPKRGRRGEILSDDDDDYGRRGHTREDEYDEDDGFLVGSDEEEEIVDDDDEEEEEFIDEPRPSSRRERTPQNDRVSTPKRDREEDASAGQDGSPAVRSKRRRIIEDEDEDE